MSKDLFIYYLWSMLIPIPTLVWIFENKSGNLPLILLIIYCLVYRPILDSYRLIRKDVIRKKDIWKIFLGYGYVKWFRELYLED